MQHLLTQPAPQSHYVQFFGCNEKRTRENLANYFRPAIDSDEGMVVVGDPDRAELFPSNPRTVFVDACDFVNAVFSDAHGDYAVFESTIVSLIRRLRKGAPERKIRAYGEAVGILWQEGRRGEAVQLEGFWNRLLLQHDFALLCGYPIDVFGADFNVPEMDGIFCSHTHLLPNDQSRDLENALDSALDDVLGGRAQALRPLMSPNFRPSWAAIPNAEALVLWLRHNVRDSADAIIARARQRYGQDH